MAHGFDRQGHEVVRLTGDDLLRQPAGFHPIFRPMRERQAAGLGEQGLSRVLGLPPVVQALELPAGDGEAQGAGNAVGELVLRLEDIQELAVETVGGELLAGASIEHLDGRPIAAAQRLDAALRQVVGPLRVGHQGQSGLVRERGGGPPP